MTKKTEEAIDKTLVELSSDLPTDDLASALDFINKEHIINDKPAFEPKKFLVPQNDKIKELKSKLDNDDEKTDLDLEEIANQADQSFYDLMDIVETAGTASKGVADIANAANSFLNIKLNSKLAKAELKLKKERQKLEKLKFERFNKEEPSDDDSSGDDIIIVK